MPTTSEGHLALVEWVAQWSDVIFALEDCRHLTRRLEQDLLGAGYRVVRMPTRLMADARRGARQPGKSDPIDADAVALAALRHPDLPVAELDGSTREVKPLVDHRRVLGRVPQISDLELNPPVPEPNSSAEPKVSQSAPVLSLGGREHSSSATDPLP